jgi:tetratricopeptide (TPR) repeat protein
MKTIDFSYFIERYNDGEMSQAERNWFQKELESNEKLRHEVELRKRTDEVLKNQNIIMLRNKLSEIERKRETSVPASKTNSKKGLYITYAAIFTGLILIGSIIFIPDRSLSNDEIIDQYFLEYEPSTSTRSAEIQADDGTLELSLAIEFYNARDFKNAAIQFNKVLESDPQDMESVLLSGLSNYYNEKYPEAKHSFNKIIADNDNFFIESAKYYLALCYIKTGEKEKAIQQLEIIKKDGSIFKANAKKIIRGLK